MAIGKWQKRRLLWKSGGRNASAPVAAARSSESCQGWNRETPSNEPTESTEGSTESSEAVTESTEGSTESSEEDTESPYETTGSSEQSTENSDEPTEDSEADAESGSKPETKYTGIIVGVVAVVLCATAGFVLIWLKKKRLQQ